MVDPKRARSVETQLRQASIASRLFDEEALVKVGRFTILERLGMGAMGAVYRAYDPALDRAIALKVLHPDAIAMADEAEVTMREEAKALARLSHPNVVTVHEVGGEASQIWIAMELVEGGDLAARLQAVEGPERFDTVVELLLQAGEGLHAAHGAGVIHRDFKPANVLVGADDRVRVADFGLSRRAADDEDASVGVGTPAYMPPEQWDEQVDARADQYAYCVVFWEALFGARPDRLGAELRAPDDADPRAARLVPVLRRGLQEDRDDRYPALIDLLEAVREVAYERPRRRQRQRRTLAVGAALLGTASVAIWQSSGTASDPCSGAAEHLEALWSTRDDTLSELAARTIPYAERAVPRIRETVETFADQWVTAHRTTCIAHARQEQSDYVFERRMSCLDQASAAYAAVADQATSPDPDIPALVRAAAGLPTPEACTVLQAMPEAERPPARIQADVDTIDTQLARARAYLDGGAVRRALELTNQAVAAARALEFGPVTARALHERGRIRAMAGPVPELSLEDAVLDLDRASELALLHRRYPLAVEAWSRRAWLEGTSGAADPEFLLERGASWVAMVQGAAPGSAEEALLHNNLGGLNLAASQRDRARDAFQRAAVISDALPYPPRELDNATTNLALVTDDNAERDTLFERIAEEQRALLGEEHPQVLQIELLHAMTTASTDAARSKLSRLVEMYQHFHPGLSQPQFEAHQELAWRSLVSGKPKEAAVHFAAAEALNEHDSLVHDVVGGFAALSRGDVSAARTRFDAVTNATDVSPWQRVHITDAHIGLAVADQDVAHLRSAAASPSVLDRPTAVLAARLQWAGDELGLQRSALVEAVDRWRTGQGTRDEIEAALREL